LVLVRLRPARNHVRRAFALIARVEIAPDLISDEERNSPLTARSRRRMRRAARLRPGFSAGHAIHRLQRAHLELVEAVGRDGAGSLRAVEECVSSGRWSSR
jgi:hypothetical protein